VISANIMTAFIGLASRHLGQLATLSMSAATPNISNSVKSVSGRHTTRGFLLWEQ
jgi:hypothetical protein